MSSSVSSASSYDIRGKSPNVDETNSKSVSTASSSSSATDDSSSAGAPQGTVGLGVEKRDASSVAGQRSGAGAIPAPAADGNAAYSPACTPHVRYLVRGGAILLGCGSLAAIIFGGMTFTVPGNPAVDAKRGESAGVMIAGAVGLAIAFVTSSLTLPIAELGQPETHPA